MANSGFLGSVVNACHDNTVEFAIVCYMTSVIWERVAANFCKLNAASITGNHWIACRCMKSTLQSNIFSGTLSHSCFQTVVYQWRLTQNYVAIIHCVILGVYTLTFWSVDKSYIGVQHNFHYSNYYRLRTSTLPTCRGLYRCSWHAVWWECHLWRACQA